MKLTRKFQLLVLSMPVLLLLASVQVSYAAGETVGGTFPACRCGGGGGGGSGGGGTLTQAEIEGLTYMREEEKLARDSYLTLYAKWGLPIFSNIASSEVMHMTRIKVLLDRYGLPDPAAGKAIGEFTNPVLQQLYDDLMAQGSQSATEALKVGVIIEEVDIADLQRYLQTTNKTDITNVFTNLMNASYHHLSAFNSKLNQ